MSKKKLTRDEMAQMLRNAHLSEQEVRSILTNWACGGATLGIFLGLALSHFFGVWEGVWIGLGVVLGLVGLVVGAATIVSEVD